jgi:hypothetical protein
MSTTTTKGKLFITEIIARLQGNTVEADAAKIARKAISAISGQISALQTKQVEDEDKLETAQEKYNDALYPTTLSDSAAYCRSILTAKTNLDAAEENLKVTTASLEFFQGLLTKFTSEDDTTTVSA